MGSETPNPRPASRSNRLQMRPHAAARHEAGDIDFAPVLDDLATIEPQHVDTFDHNMLVGSASDVAVAVLHTVVAEGDCWSISPRDITMDLRLSLVGLIIGFLIGLTGMGGGSLMTPIMILIMGVKPVIAVGTDLAYGAVTKMVGGSFHLCQNTVHRRTAYRMAAGSVPATLLGVGLVSWLEHTNPGLVSVFLMRCIAVVLIVVALVLIGKSIIARLAARRRRLVESDWRDNL